MLTQEVADEICELVGRGKPIKHACGAVGIDDSTVRQWRGLVRQGKAGAELLEFFTRLARARSTGVLALLDRIDEGDEKGVSNGRAKGAQWLLERCFPEEFAPRLNVKLEEGLELVLEDVELVCGSKDCGCYEAILAQLRARETGGAEAPGDPSEEAGLH